MEDRLGLQVPALLQSSPLMATVALCGSRASGTAGRYSDWDFRVSAQDFAAFAPELPGLVRVLDPLVAQWDRLSDEACYMLIVSGPTKVDLIFADVPNERELPSSSPSRDGPFEELGVKQGIEAGLPRRGVNVADRDPVIGSGWAHEQAHGFHRRCTYRLRAVTSSRRDRTLKGSGEKPANQACGTRPAAVSAASISGTV
jgi:hypothetical protein